VPLVVASNTTDSKRIAVVGLEVYVEVLRIGISTTADFECCALSCCLEKSSALADERVSEALRGFIVRHITYDGGYDKPGDFFD